VIGIENDQRGSGFSRIFDRECIDPDIVDMGAYEYHPQIDITSGLIAYYPLTGNTDDESGNGYDGTNNGASTSSNRYNVAGTAFYFDGINDYINTMLPANIFNGDATISMWINTDLAKDQNGLFNSCGDSYFLRSRITQDGRVWINIPQCGGEFQTSSSVITSNTWHHLVIEVDDKFALKVYVDGLVKLSVPL